MQDLKFEEQKKTNIERKIDVIQNELDGVVGKIDLMGDRVESLREKE